jgi:hypothetical protein
VFDFRHVTVAMMLRHCRLPWICRREDALGGNGDAVDEMHSLSITALPPWSDRARCAIVDQRSCTRCRSPFLQPLLLAAAVHSERRLLLALSIVLLISAVVTVEMHLDWITMVNKKTAHGAGALVEIVHLACAPPKNDLLAGDCFEFNLL